MEAYTRQQMIGELNIPEVITVIGAGGLGTWVAYLAAISGVQRLVLYAPGEVWESDLARFPFPADSVGLPRGESLAREILRIRPEADIDLRGRFREETEPGCIEGPVFNCAAGPDGFDDKIKKFAEANKSQYVSGAYNGMEFMVFGPEGPNLEPRQEPLGSWNAVLAVTASIMLSSAFSSPSTFAGTMTDLSKGLEDVAAFVTDRPAR